MTLPTGFLVKDVLFLIASFYLLKQDVTRAALEGGAELMALTQSPTKQRTALIAAFIERTLKGEQ